MIDRLTPDEHSALRFAAATLRGSAPERAIEAHHAATLEALLKRACCPSVACDGRLRLSTRVGMFRASTVEIPPLSGDGPPAYESMLFVDGNAPWRPAHELGLGLTRWTDRDAAVQGHWELISSLGQAAPMNPSGGLEHLQYALVVAERTRLGGVADWLRAMLTEIAEKRKKGEE